MKSFLISCFCLLTIGHSAFNNLESDPVKIVYDGQVIEAKQLVKGKINFYTANFLEDQADYVKAATVIPQEMTLHYFIEKERRIERITEYNYKKLIKNYLPDAPDLHKSLGKLGFRFENIPHMIQFYNDFRT